MSKTWSIAEIIEIELSKSGAETEWNIKLGMRSMRLAKLGIGCFNYICQGSCELYHFNAG